MQHFHTFTCFVYVQNGKIQGRFGLADLEGVDQPRDGERFPVGRSELYLNYSTRDQALDKLIETDYVSPFIIRELVNHPKRVKVLKLSSLRIVVILNPRAIATAAELSSTTQNRFSLWWRIIHTNNMSRPPDYVSSFRNQTPCFFVTRVRYAPSSASSGRVEGNVQGAKATNFMTKRIGLKLT